MKHVRIEVTNCCNLRCKMCPQSFLMNRKKEMMDENLFHKIVEDLSKNIKPCPISFHISGEPLLHKSICDFVRIVKKNSFFPWIVTNATLLTDTMSKNLIEAGLWKISFSFEGISKEIYEKIRTGANYEEVLSNIENFLSINSKLKDKVITELVCVDLPTIPVALIKEFSERMKMKFDIINVSGYVDWIGKIGENLKEIHNGYPCFILNNDINILSDGSVVPCSVDVDGEMKYGDFKTMSFSQIMESKTRMGLKLKLESGCYSGLPCSKCYVPIKMQRTVRTS